ncbi:hypothetical protein V5O48_017586 [Marasmius crinis-equi]|uniref:Uncharacterized protein n=1 Tax=Marasmius crinis-equi TaxID=585013 RepID=A0ABR3ENL0_9AGAR
MHPPTFGEQWGAMMIAFMFDLVLYGIGMVLVMQYFRSYKAASDSVPTRCSVGLIFFFATAHTVFFSHQIYTQYVKFFNQPERLDVIVFSASGMLLAIVGLHVHSDSAVLRTEIVSHGIRNSDILRYADIHHGAAGKEAPFMSTGGNDLCFYRVLSSDLPSSVPRLSWLSFRFRSESVCSVFVADIDAQSHK